MPPKRQSTEAGEAIVVDAGDESLAVSTVSADYPSGLVLPRHRHRRAQLTFAVDGVLAVTTQDGIWVVPPMRALWVPGNVAHAIRMSGPVRMRAAYFAPEALPFAETPPRPLVFQVSPLLRELLVRLAERGGYGGAELSERSVLPPLLALLFEELAAATAAPLELPIPADPRLRRVTRALAADPGDSRSVADWAKVAGMSERNFLRLFPRQTGMRLVRWRQQARLVRALEQLGAGETVTAVALDLGYESTSAFISMFRRSLGVTPSRYFAR